MQLQGVKGMQDVLPPEGRIWRALETLAAEVHGRFGYDEVRTPILESADLFQRSIGDETDIVAKEMYTFTDKGGRSVTLRPEGTAPLVRAYVEHKLHGGRPVHRMFYLGPMFRYERSQKGRLRQFHQIGAEVYGLASPAADAEVLILQDTLFRELGVPGLTLEINNLGTAASRARFADALRAHLAAHAAELCGDCVRRTATNPLRALDCKVPTCRPVLDAAPSILAFGDPESDAHFDAVRKRLDLGGIAYTVNPTIVRGLDYYTKVVFEFTTTAGLGAKNTLSAGGRYDGLIGQLGGPETPAVGYACGVERLLLVLGDQAQAIGRAPVTVFAAVLSEGAEDKAAAVVRTLRQAGFRVEEDLNRAGLKSQMKSANRAGARFTLLFGGDELARGEVTVRDMQTGEQQAVALDPAAVAGHLTGKKA
jgi:histidyl-tRNA synthetase